MDNTLMNAPTYNDPVQNIMKRQAFENSLRNNTSDNGDCDLTGTCSLGKKGNRLNTYDKYLEGAVSQEASHQNFQASTATSQTAPSGSAFDTTLDRYSPNVAQVINF